MGLLGLAFVCPPFLVCREQTPASLTFPEFLRVDLNSCSSGKGEDAETKEEQPGNNSAALGQSLGSASRDTRNSIFKLSIEKEMAIRSNILAWRIPRMEEPGGGGWVGGDGMGGNGVTFQRVAKTWAQLT